MNEAFNFDNISTAIVFGAGHGIGLAVVKRILETSPDAIIHATFRNKLKAKELLELAKNESNKLTIHNIDPANEQEINDLSNKIGEYDILINSIGILHNDSGLDPEKSLKDITYDNLIQSFKVNAAFTPMIAKYFIDKSRKKSISAFVTISAKVGSLDDNKIGGWYAYRASKAALNMFLINISHEAARKHLQTIVLSIHPGTTITELSKPFTGKTSLKLHSTDETAFNIMNVIQGKTLEESGRFYSWDGELIAW